jgi:hypothetical protein
VERRVLRVGAVGFDRERAGVSLETDAFIGQQQDLHVVLLAARR